jgi:hypothetical protein
MNFQSQAGETIQLLSMYILYVVTVATALQVFVAAVASILNSYALSKNWNLELGLLSLWVQRFNRATYLCWKLNEI